MALRKKSRQYRVNSPLTQKRLSILDLTREQSIDEHEDSFHNSSFHPMNRSKMISKRSHETNRVSNGHAFINFDPEDEIAQLFSCKNGFSISVLLNVRDDGDVSVIIPSSSAFVNLVITKKACILLKFSFLNCRSSNILGEKLIIFFSRCLMLKQSKNLALELSHLNLSMKYFRDPLSLKWFEIFRSTFIKFL